MACTSGCLTEQKGSPCLKGLPNVEELSQANLNSGFFICWSSVEGFGEMFQFFHHSFMFTSLFPTWKRGRAKGRDQDGKGSGRFCKKTSCSSSWTWLCHSHPNSPNDTNPWEHSPLKSLLCASRVLVICLHEMNSSPPSAWSCAQTTPELGCSALQELWAPWDAHKLSCWKKHNWTVLSQSILLFPLHLPSFPSQPFSTSVNSAFKVFFTSTRYPKLFDKYALAGQFLLPSLLQENVVL